MMTFCFGVYIIKGTVPRDLPLLSMTSAVNFATGTAGVVFNDTGGKYGENIILLTT
jgi:hypothetical protein